MSTSLEKSENGVQVYESPVRRVNKKFNFWRGIYNKDKNYILGRTPKNWGNSLTFIKRKKKREETKNECLHICAESNVARSRYKNIKMEFLFTSGLCSIRYLFLSTRWHRRHTRSHFSFYKCMQCDFSLLLFSNRILTITVSRYSTHGLLISHCACASRVYS